MANSKTVDVSADTTVVATTPNPYAGWDEEAVKNTIKDVENPNIYMILKIGYETYVLPYSDGITIVKAFEKAIIIDSFYSFEDAKIKEEKPALETKSVSGTQVLFKKTMHLLRGGAL